jgi:Zn-dependent M28 family amino/carboxypeptidase
MEISLMGRLWITLGASALLFGFASAEARDVQQPDGAAIKTTAVRLLQKTNAGRLGQLQAILREQSLPFEIQAVPNPSRQSDARPEGHNILLNSTAQSGPAIVVGAHFDAATLRDGQLSGGMVDNAAGVAVLVHLATALKSQPLRHPVRFVFFDLEEEGLIGSQQFVSSMKKDSVAVMINLDTLQGGDTLIYGPAAGVEHEKLNRAMRAVCAAAGEFGCIEFPAYPESDEISFRQGGVPSISLAVLPLTEAHQLWLMLNGGERSGLERGFEPEVLRTIHTPDDQPEKLDPKALATAYRAVADLLRRLDEDQH